MKSEIEQQVLEHIEEYFALYEKRALRGARPDVVEKYSRVNLTGQLIKIFESLLEP